MLKSVAINDNIVYRFFKGVLGTRFGSLELKIGSLESQKSGPYRSIPGT